MKVRTLIAGAAVVLLCGGVCVAQEAPAPAASVAPEAAPSPAPESAPEAKPKHNLAHHHRRHHGKRHAQMEFTEQELQEMQAHSPSQ